jgi:hypothetical protein
MSLRLGRPKGDIRHAVWDKPRAASLGLRPSFYSLRSRAAASDLLRALSSGHFTQSRKARPSDLPLEVSTDFSLYRPCACTLHPYIFVGVFSHDEVQRWYPGRLVPKGPGRASRSEGLRAAAAKGFAQWQRRRAAKGCGPVGARISQNIFQTVNG